jgi:hypothetical protein
VEAISIKDYLQDLYKDERNFADMEKIQGEDRLEITTEDMDQAFKKLSTNKASGIDRLKDSHLKSAKVKVAVQEKLR